MWCVHLIWIFTSPCILLGWFLYIYFFIQVSVYFIFRISAKMVRKGNAISSNTSQEDLDIKCLQLLRAVVHSEERKLPEDWDTKTAESKIKRYILCLFTVWIGNWFKSFSYRDILWSSDLVTFKMKEKGGAETDIKKWVCIRMFNASWLFTCSRAFWEKLDVKLQYIVKIL